jgi:hypothetical protein
VVLGPGSAFKAGGPPIIPPSTNFIDGAEVEKSSAIWRALRGEMAFRSR